MNGAVRASAGDAAVCSPRQFYECLQPRLVEYVRNNEATSCGCPRQCRHLAYDYAISQAQMSDFHMLFVKDVYKLNYTTDQLRNDQCVLEVCLLLHFGPYRIFHSRIFSRPQVAPTAQERASHAGLCHAFLVLLYVATFRDTLHT